MAKFPVQENSYTLKYLAKSQIGLEGHEFKAVKKAIMQLGLRGLNSSLTDWLTNHCVIDQKYASL